MKQTFAAKTFAVHSFRAGTWAGQPVVTAPVAPAAPPVAGGILPGGKSPSWGEIASRLFGRFRARGAAKAKAAASGKARHVAVFSARGAAQGELSGRGRASFVPDTIALEDALLLGIVVDVDAEAQIALEDDMLLGIR